MNYGMGYYDGNEYDADEYEEFEEQAPQQQRPKSPGLRQYLKQQAAEIKALKKTVDEQKAMLGELLEGDSSQLSQGAPQSRLTAEEQLQLSRMQAMGVVGVAPPAGTEAEQISQIRNAKSPDELTSYLRSQGSVVGQNYEGMGY